MSLQRARLQRICFAATTQLKGHEKRVLPDAAACKRARGAGRRDDAKGLARLARRLEAPAGQRPVKRNLVALAHAKCARDGDGALGARRIAELEIVLEVDGEVDQRSARPSTASTAVKEVLVGKNMLASISAVPRRAAAASSSARTLPKKTVLQ